MYTYTYSSHTAFRTKRNLKQPKSTKVILNVDDSLATALGVEAGKWQLKNKIPETEGQCGLEKFLIRHQGGGGRSLVCGVCGVEFADKELMNCELSMWPCFALWIQLY